jgi:Ca-activated chloride channel family protein
VYHDAIHRFAPALARELNWNMSGLIPSWLAHPWWLLLLAALPLLGIVRAVAHRRRRRALVQMGVVPPRERWFSLRVGVRVLRGMGRGMLFTLLVFGIAGPEWGREWGQTGTSGRDVIVVLDLSRSMFARDVQPNRLGRAREAVLDLVQNSLEKKGGYRLGLVVYAAKAKVLCPLTHDTAHFREMLSRLDLQKPPTDLLPSQDGESGTRIGEGLIEAVRLFDERATGAQDILLFSDGDDPAPDSATDRAHGVRAAVDARIPIHTVGLGDPEHDTPVPFDYDTLAVTRLQEGPMREMARSTGGIYVPVHPGRTASISELLEDQMTRSVRQRSDDSVPIYKQRYGWFFALALLLLTLDLLLGVRWRNIPLVRRLRLSALRRPRVAIPAAGVVLLLGAASASELLDLMRQGNAAFRRQEYEEAEGLYQRAQDRTDDPGAAAFNRGVVQYRLGHFSAAESHYRQALSDAVGERRLYALYGLANALVQQNLGTGPLREAVTRYRTCLTEFAETFEQDADFRNDINNNLELAKLLYQRAEAAEREHGPAQPPQSGNTENPEDNHKRPEDPPGSGDSQGSGSRPDPHKGSVPMEAQQGQDPIPIDDQAGGIGRLPPVPDRAELTPISPEAAAAHLRAAGERLLQQRRLAESVGPPPRGGLDR